MTVEAPAVVSEPVASGPIRVLFVCVGNSARSILAEAILRHVGGERFEVHSAGSAPKGVNPLTLRTLAEAGLPTDGYTSTHVNDYLGQRFDYVITLCDEAQEACPVFPGVTDALHWGYDDPAAVEGSEDQRLAAFRRVYRQLSERIRTFIILAERQRREATPGELETTPEEATTGRGAPPGAVVPGPHGPGDLGRRARDERDPLRGGRSARPRGRAGSFVPGGGVGAGRGDP